MMRKVLLFIVILAWHSIAGLEAFCSEIAEGSPASISGTQSRAKEAKGSQERLEEAVRLREAAQFQRAECLLEQLLSGDAAEDVKKKALLELSECARDQDKLLRTQEILAQYVSRWPSDAAVPEILLRQGRIFREIGIHNLAFAKFYAVMTSALVVNKDSLDYYKKLVQDAQAEIAETHLALGKFAEAADFYSRVLRQNPSNARALQFRMLRALASAGKHEELVSQARNYLDRYTDGPDQAEVRFHFSLALREVGRSSEALQQVLRLLQEQSAGSTPPDLLVYWRQRAGNEVANQFYEAGDFTRALAVYMAVMKLQSADSWRLPVLYQIGLTYEKLAQPELAAESYLKIVEREADLDSTARESLKTIVEMARWRAGFVKWQLEKARELPAILPVLSGSGSTSEAGRKGAT